MNFAGASEASGGPCGEHAGLEYNVDVLFHIDRRRALGWVPREQNMLKGHLPRVIYHLVYEEFAFFNTIEMCVD